MGVEQASAVKSRYRLHSRLGLSKGDSLEDELRRPDVGGQGSLIHQAWGHEADYRSYIYKYINGGADASLINSRCVCPNVIPLLLWYGQGSC